MNFYKINVKAKTWVRDSYGLFDYETKDIIKNHLAIEQSGFLMRQGNEIRFSPIEKLETNGTDTNAMKLITFLENNGNCFIKEIENTNLWMPLSSKLDKSRVFHSLHEGDEIKMGRILFKVLQLKLNKEEKLDQNYKSFMGSLMENFDLCQKNKDMSNCASANDIFEKKICRICLSDYDDEENPLLNPCNCAGTMSSVHYFCLQTWLIKRLNLEKFKGVISILWQSLICELCHAVYPLTITYKDRNYDLINFFENPEFINEEGNHNNSTFCNKTKSSMLLKSFTKEGSPNGLHLIEFSNSNNNEITLVFYNFIILNENFSNIKGRGNDCHIRVNDISVSRQHCKIYCDGNKVTLQDNSSKFGTLIKICKKDLNLGEKNVYLQVGRTFFEVEISKKWSFFSFCFNCSDKSDIYLKEKEKEEENK